MNESNEANDVDVFDDGNPRTGVVVTASMSSRWLRPGVILGSVVTVVLVVLSMTIMIVYLAPSVDRLTENSARGEKERDELLGTIADLQTELDRIGNEQSDERSVDDCVSLYLYDIEVAKGIAQVTLGDNLATAVLFDGGVEDNRALAQEVFDADADLRAALEALRLYQEIDPPPNECPHPRAAGS